MTRTSYNESENPIGYVWDATVARCIRGKPGQRALRALLAALEALPEKRLIDGALADRGEVCAIGALIAYKQGAALDLPWVEAIDRLDGVDSVNYTAELAKPYGMAWTLAWEIVNMNDDWFSHCTPEERYERILAWVRSQIIATPQEQP